MIKHQRLSATILDVHYSIVASKPEYALLTYIPSGIRISPGDVAWSLLQEILVMCIVITFTFIYFSMHESPRKSPSSGTAAVTAAAIFILLGIFGFGIRGSF